MHSHLRSTQRDWTPFQAVSPHEPNSKGSMKYTKHVQQPSDFVKGQSAGSAIEKALGDEDLTDEQAEDQLERKI